jgi:hypothetical protein
MKNISRTLSKTTKIQIIENFIFNQFFRNLLPSKISIPQARRRIERPFAPTIKYRRVTI